MNYQEARAYMKEAEAYGSVLGLENMQEMAARLENPQDALNFIHIAGTNGKGSVLAYTSTILKEAGYSVGRYISPTLFSYRGRIQINEERISREDFALYLSKIAKVIEEMVEEGLSHPTPFEIETMLSFLYFKEKKCDFVVMECGMGGALDATNIMSKVKVAVLTSISMDHMGFLGNNLSEIAKTKSGIILSGCHVVSALQEEEVKEVIESVCRKKECHLKMIQKKNIQLLSSVLEKQDFLYREKFYKICLSGEHQVENAAVAIEVIRSLREQGYVISDDAIKNGLKDTKWEGRFTVVGRNPYFIIDGAHNPDAAQRLRDSVQRYFPNKKCIFIMGVFKDKEYRKILEITSDLAEEIITLQTPDNPRALPARELASEARKYHSSVRDAKSVQEAVDLAFADAKENDVILAFGSLSFLGEITKDAIKKYE